MDKTTIVQSERKAAAAAQLMGKFTAVSKHGEALFRYRYPDHGG